jgi:hypothetical protein
MRERERERERERKRERASERARESERERGGWLERDTHPPSRNRPRQSLDNWIE